MRGFAGRGVAVLADDHDGLWVALEGSLVLARKAELLALAEGRAGPLHVLSFDERDGLPSTEFTSAGQSSASTRKGQPPGTSTRVARPSRWRSRPVSVPSQTLPSFDCRRPRTRT